MSKYLSGWDMPVAGRQMGSMSGSLRIHYSLIYSGIPGTVVVRNTVSFCTKSGFGPLDLADEKYSFITGFLRYRGFTRTGGKGSLSACACCPSEGLDKDTVMDKTRGRPKLPLPGVCGK